ncbi:MAG: thioredoxin 1 [Euryarchaeota archaeon]|nr:thioredoxin 1 [Euryarchaeota archaeon]
MQKIMFKTLGILTLVLFVMSMTGAAATSTPCKAYADKFSFSPSKYSGNVLSNDKGSGLKVVSTSKTTNSGKVTMKSNGVFIYKPASSSKTTITDSFTYTIADKYGKKSFAKVTINYKKTQVSTGTVIEVTQLSQINTYLKKGPVFFSSGATWCPYCQKLKPILKELATEYNGKATIVSIDIDKSSKLADYFGVDGVPDSSVIVGTKNGKYVYMQQNGKTTTDRSKARILGLEDKKVYEKVLNLALK